MLCMSGIYMDIESRTLWRFRLYEVCFGEFGSKCSYLEFWFSPCSLSIFFCFYKFLGIINFFNTMDIFYLILINCYVCLFLFHSLFSSFNLLYIFDKFYLFLLVIFNKTYFICSFFCKQAFGRTLIVTLNSLIYKQKDNF